MSCTFYHLKYYQREVWNLINKFESFNIKFNPHVDNSDTNMLINEASNLNLYDGSIDRKFSIEICRPLIPSTNWRISNDDQHFLEHLRLRETSKGSIVNEEYHQSLLQASILDEKPKLRNVLSNHIIRLESHFGLHNTFKRTMNVSFKWELKKLYSSPKTVVKMKCNKLLAT
jgi:hypothetical protein